VQANTGWDNAIGPSFAGEAKKLARALSNFPFAQVPLCKDWPLRLHNKVEHWLALCYILDNII